MRKTKIFFVSTEVYPFVKGGRAGEFAGSLPTYLQMAGHEVRVMMPKYSLINERKHIIRDIIRLREIPIATPFEEGKVSVKSGFLPESKTQIYFLDYEKFFKRTDLFRDRRTGQFYKDNDERFMFFCRTAIETLKTLGWQPDIIHCCDWATGILPAMVRQEQLQHHLFKKTIVVYSLNNLEDTGVFDKSSLAKSGIEGETLDLEKCLFKNKLSFMKCGISFSDAVTIPSLHKELKSVSKPRSDVEAILATAKHVTDIPYGADHNVWNPANNNSLHKAYTPDKYDRRRVNKEKFLEARRTGFDPQRLILGIVAERLEVQKKVIVSFLKAIRDVPLQVFIIADEPPTADAALKQVMARNANHTYFTLQDPDDQIRHNFFAVCDLFWVPPTESFSDITFMNGIHYGTIPLIPKSSPVAGHFEPIKDKSYAGNAMIYSDEKDAAHKLEIAATISKEDPARWESLAKHAMKTDLSWNQFLAPVLRVYEKAFSKLK